MLQDNLDDFTIDDFTIDDDEVDYVSTTRYMHTLCISNLYTLDENFTP